MVKITLNKFELKGLRDKGLTMLNIRGIKDRAEIAATKIVMDVLHSR
jgi:hypothetical protein